VAIVKKPIKDKRKKEPDNCVFGIFATSIVLAVDELQEMENASSLIKIMGSRYTEQMGSSTGL
jgi:hypothetical protein